MSGQGRHLKCGVGGACLAALLVFAPRPTQAQVRLDDIFTSSTLSGEKPPSDEASARLDSTIRNLKTSLSSSETTEVKLETERLLALLDKADPRYLEALHLRAEAFSRDPDPAQVRALAAEYLKLAPKGEHARWFHVQLARQHSTQQLWELSADAWKFALESPGGPLPPIEALEAVESMGKAARPEDLRGVLVGSGWQNWPMAERERAEIWLLDSLLVQDDPGGIPLSIQPRTPSGLLRYALLMKLRRDDSRLSRTTLALRPLVGQLSPAEREALAFLESTD